MSLLRKPWLHFLVLGTALFYAQGVFFPPPLPTVGPLQETQLEGLRRQWFATTGRMPTEAQLSAMIRAELDREILFREALELELYRVDPIVQQRLVRNMRFLKLDRGRDDAELFREALRMELHLGDEVVKRRLVQVMEQILLSRQPPAAVTAAELAAAFEAQREEFMEPPRYTLQHVFLARDRESEAGELLARLREAATAPADALQFSSPFLPGYRFVSQSPAQLARQFGAAFMQNLEQANPSPGAWVGPVQSTYGIHLVWVEQIEPARAQSLAEASSRLRRELDHERRRQALDRAIAQVREDYEVVL